MGLDNTLKVILFSLIMGWNSQVKLVQVNFGSEKFKATYKQTCDLFAKYQMAIHNDPPDECDERQVRFVSNGLFLSHAFDFHHFFTFILIIC